MKFKLFYLISIFLCAVILVESSEHKSENLQQVKSNTLTQLIDKTSKLTADELEERRLKCELIKLKQFYEKSKEEVVQWIQKETYCDSNRIKALKEEIKNYDTKLWYLHGNFIDLSIKERIKILKNCKKETEVLQNITSMQNTKQYDFWNIGTLYYAFVESQVIPFCQENNMNRFQDLSTYDKLGRAQQYAISALFLGKTKSQISLPTDVNQNIMSFLGIDYIDGKFDMSKNQQLRKDEIQGKNIEKFSSISNQQDLLDAYEELYKVYKCYYKYSKNNPDDDIGEKLMNDIVSSSSSCYDSLICAYEHSYYFKAYIIKPMTQFYKEDLKFLKKLEEKYNHKKI